ncbi:hypothetical protein MMC07_001196 [Pseudocyphellaria aurata]|nr:hypothetical protein [Pseudocyphellaria aurata]
MAGVPPQMHHVICIANLQPPARGGFACDNICVQCSAKFYLREKHLQIREQVLAAGGRVEPFPPLPPMDVPLWEQWQRDRERFRSVAVDDGQDGELGQLAEVSDSGENAGLPWKTSKISGHENMLGWKEDLGFDGFLGQMGKLEMGPEPKGLTVDQVLSGIRVQNLALRNNSSGTTEP